MRRPIHVLLFEWSVYSAISDEPVQHKPPTILTTNTTNCRHFPTQYNEDSIAAAARASK